MRRSKLEERDWAFGKSRNVQQQHTLPLRFKVRARDVWDGGKLVESHTPPAKCALSVSGKRVSTCQNLSRCVDGESKESAVDACGWQGGGKNAISDGKCALRHSGRNRTERCLSISQRVSRVKKSFMVSFCSARSKLRFRFFPCKCQPNQS